MSELFEEQLQALRARSLHRKLREIGTPARSRKCGSLGGNSLTFPPMIILGLAADPLLRRGGDRGDRGVWCWCGRLAPDQWDAVAARRSRNHAGEMEAGARGDLLQQRLRRRGRNAAGAGLETGCRDSRQTLPRFAHRWRATERRDDPGFSSQPSRQTREPPGVGAAGASGGARHYCDGIGLQHGWRPRSAARVGRAEETLSGRVCCSMKRMPSGWWDRTDAGWPPSSVWKGRSTCKWARSANR